MNLFLKDGASFGSVNEAGQPAFCHVFSFLRVSCLSLADSSVARPDIPRKQSGCADKRSCSFKIRRDSATCKLARDTAVKLSSFYIKRNFCEEYRTGTISATAFLIRWLDHAWSLEIKTDLASCHSEILLHVTHTLPLPWMHVFRTKGEKKPLKRRT